LPTSPLTSPDEYRLLYAGTHLIGTAPSTNTAEALITFVAREIEKVRAAWASQSHTPTLNESLEALNELATKWVAETPHRCILELRYDDAFKYIQKNPSSMLHIDTMVRHSDCVALRLTFFFFCANAFLFKGYAILHHLVKVNEPEVLRSLLLLPKTAKDLILDVNVRDRIGFTPLHWGTFPFFHSSRQIVNQSALSSLL